MSLKKSLASDLIRINWLSNCGRKDARFPCRYAADWIECNMLLEDPGWESTTLEASNEISEFLSINHRDAFQKWHDLSEFGRGFIEEKVMPRLVSATHGKPLSDVLFDCIKWDILHAIIEHEYLDLLPKPCFFMTLFDVYRSGHLPCGWENGSWPNGNVVIY